MTETSLFEEKTRPEDFVGTRPMISDDLNIIEKHIEKTFSKEMREEVQRLTRKKPESRLRDFN